VRSRIGRLRAYAPVVRRGQSRAVVLVGRWAVKVPRLASRRQFLWGLLSNLAEAERRGVEGACPILVALPLSLALVLPRCEALPEGAEVPEHVRRLAGFDDKPCSYGLHLGRVVALDFHGDV
jgi:hypothetical protein